MSDQPDVHNEARGELGGVVVQAGTITQLSVSPGQPAVPRQLPLVPRDFVGRADQLAALDALLPGTGVVISAVDGMAGVGKTTLAVRWAYRVQQRFPDGTLYADLRGYGPGEPATPGDVLAGFLAALGVPADRIPADLGARAGLYRSVLAQRQVLIVLDNANAAEQVRPLLPGGSGFVVVTSRSSLAGLVIGQGATRMTLDVLTEPEALDLVRAVLGPQRADAEPESLVALVRACARLPLALRIAAGRAAVHPNLTVGEVVTELGSPGRLDVLSVPADERTSVRGVFDWSYRRLTGEQARMFRRLGLHPGPEFSLPAAAAVAGVDVAEARGLLDALAELHLIEPVDRDRYRCHDLLHTYAAERVDRDDDAAEREDARRTLLGWYAHHAWTAARTVAATLTERHESTGLATPVHPQIVFAGPAEAWAWGERECANVVAGIRVAVRHDALRVAVLLADLSVVPLSRRRLWEDLFEVCRLGLTAARRLGDRRSEYQLLECLASAHRDVGQWQESWDAVAAALELARDLGDQWSQAQSLCYLGVLCGDRGRHAEASRYLRSALPLSVGAQGGQLEGDIELYLGSACVGLGRYDEAVRHAERSRALHRQAGNPHGEAYVLHCMARAQQGLGEHAEAIALCEQAQRSESALIEQREHAAILDTLGISLAHTGDPARAISCWQAALTVFDEFDESRARDLRDRIHAMTTA